MTDKTQFNWDDVELEQPSSYVGEVLIAEIRDVPTEVYEKWTKQPNDGVTPIGLYMAIKPLSFNLIREGDADFFEYHLTLNSADGSIKRKGSSVSIFRESCRLLGFADPTETVGRVFNVERIKQQFGGSDSKIQGWVMRFVEYLRDGYTHEGELREVDLRNKDAQEEPENQPTVSTKLTKEAVNALAIALDGIDATDDTAVMKAVRKSGATKMSAAVSDLLMHDELIEALVVAGVVVVGPENIIVASPVAV